MGIKIAVCGGRWERRRKKAGEKIIAFIHIFTGSRRLPLFIYFLPFFISSASTYFSTVKTGFSA